MPKVLFGSTEKLKEIFMFRVKVDVKLDKNIPLMEIRFSTSESKNLQVVLQDALKTLEVAQKEGAMPLPFQNVTETPKENQILFRLMFNNH